MHTECISDTGHTCDVFPNLLHKLQSVTCAVFVLSWWYLGRGMKLTRHNFTRVCIACLNMLCVQTIKLLYGDGIFSVNLIYQAPLTMDGLLMKEVWESSEWLDHQLPQNLWNATVHVHVIWKAAHALPMVRNVLRCVGFNVTLTRWQKWKLMTCNLSSIVTMMMTIN